MQLEEEHPYMAMNQKNTVKITQKYVLCSSNLKKRATALKRKKEHKESREMKRSQSQLLH